MMMLAGHLQYFAPFGENEARQPYQVSKKKRREEALFALMLHQMELEGRRDKSSWVRVS